MSLQAIYVIGLSCNVNPTQKLMPQQCRVLTGTLNRKSVYFNLICEKQITVPPAQSAYAI